MRLRIAMLALASILIGAEAVQAQWGRGGRGYGRGGTGFYAGYGNPYSGFSVGVGNAPRYYGYGYGSPNYGYNRGYGPRYTYVPSTMYYGPNTTYVPNAVYEPNVFPSTTYVEPQTGITPASATVNAPTGMKITEVFDNGAARKTSLQKGDIITAVGSTRTQSLEELQQALATTNGPVEVSYFNGMTMKAEKTRVTPKDGRIGVVVVPAYLP